MKYICHFCQTPLKQTEEMHSSKSFIYLCPQCPLIIQHMFYGDAEQYLTLRTRLRINNKQYTLYLYPTHNPSVLLTNENGKEMIKLPSMKEFTPQNIQSKVERLLQLKPFY